ncbi:MAG TPA: type II toxin-antitoxin system RelB/DinJ family antitoxin [Bacilli bacterium]|nr:type II toxin-antitoxin system RelB/DinJ family antitoxin [Bacilli bacterium]
MEKTANINIRTDLCIKEEAESLFEDLGLNMTSAITMFLIQSIKSQSIPFEIRREIPNEKTIRALKEAHNKNKTSKMKTYKDMEEVYGSLNL